MKLLSFLLVLVAYLQGKCNAGLYMRQPSSREGQLLDIIIPRMLLEDFEYTPTKEGYKYGYKLADGTRREEVGLIANSDDLNDGVLAMMAQGDRDSTRPMMKNKSRKLSPKALQGLAG